VEAEFKRMADQFGMDVEMVKKYLQTDTIRDQLCSRKAVDIVVENATAVKPEEKPAEEASAEEASAEKPKRTRKKKTDEESPAGEAAEKPKRTRKKKTEDAEKPEGGENHGE
jgi:trigger factor